MQYHYKAQLKKNGMRNTTKI